MGRVVRVMLPGGEEVNIWNGECKFCADDNRETEQVLELHSGSIIVRCIKHRTSYEKINDLNI